MADKLLGKANLTAANSANRQFFYKQKETASHFKTNVKDLYFYHPYFQTNKNLHYAPFRKL